MNRRLTKNKILSRYIKTVQKNKDLSLEQFFYRIFINTTFRKSKNSDSDDNDERDAVANNEHSILVPKGMNCIPRYPVDYDYARGMLILHKVWSKDNTLNSILKDHQKTINTFLTMIDNKGSCLWSLFNTTPQ
jgi:hypothetical protein